MKLGLAYNIYDGEEMLPFSLKNLRPFADFIVIVYQTTSNFGKPAHPRMEKALKILKTAEVIDELYYYNPTFEYVNKKIAGQNGTINELRKRNIGLEICRANGCDTMMTIDCDELYDPIQFKWAMEDFENGSYDTSFAKMQTFYKLPTMQIDPPESYFCPVFYKIKKDTKFELISNYPVNIDNTRKVKAGNCRIYMRSELEMYHYAYVRNNLKSKITNYSARCSADGEFIEGLEIENDKIKINNDSYIPHDLEVGYNNKVYAHFENWKSKEDGALMIGVRPYKLKEVENKFNIKL